MQSAKNTAETSDIICEQISIDPNKSWLKSVQPFIDRYKLGAAINQHVCYNPIGCAALAKLLERMATIIDTEIVKRETENG